MHYSRNSIVLVPIPFTDLTSSKVRPAVVIGAGSHPDDLFVIPITSQLHQTSLRFSDWQTAGLNVPCGLKAQLSTIDGRLVRKVVGTLTSTDTAALDTQLRQWLSL